MASLHTTEVDNCERREYPLTVLLCKILPIYLPYFITIYVRYHVRPLPCTSVTIYGATVIITPQEYYMLLRALGISVASVYYSQT